MTRKRHWSVVRRVSWRAARRTGANPMRKSLSVLTRGLVLAGALLFGPGSEAAERVVVGVTGTPNALAWPFYIAMEKGFFAAEDINIDQVFAPSSAAMMLQLAAGALDITVEGAFVDTMRAIEKGAPISIVRILVQTPPYELLAKPSIKSSRSSRARPSRSAAQRTSRASTSIGCWSRMASRTAMSTWCSLARLQPA